MGNHLAQHPSLSAAAIGLGVHIQSLPEGADVTVKTLTNRFKEGEITIRRALNELVVEGYLERHRMPLGGGRFATRIVSYDKPGCGLSARRAAEPVAEVEVEAEIAIEYVPEEGLAEDLPTPEPPALPGPAADLLARLRAVDSRLLLPWREVLRLAPAVDAWLAREVTPAQVVRTLTAALPPAHVPIHHPGRFLEYRLSALLPPRLPAGPPPSVVEGPAPLITCDGCDRAFRSRDAEAVCGDCREELVPAG
ncbi:helix-turn-helix domain-containing protein [Streptomyces gardneri]|uniref:helix-turn-helix domain-containing protein n=1 Tax=Streptomyces gardneri TaxID=66892 RepID=UPI0035DF37D7